MKTQQRAATASTLPQQPSDGGSTAEPDVGRLMQRAAVWTGLNSFVLRLAQFGVGVIVARLIAPEEFGVFAVALIVHAIVSNVSDLGVSAAIVRTDRNLDDVAPTVFTIAVISASALTTAMFLTAPAMASALGAPAASTAIQILSLAILLGGLTSVPYGILVKRFEQQKRFIADVSNFAVSTVLVIILAVHGYGAEGLAWSRVVGLVVSSVLMLVMITPRYRPGWRVAEAGPVLSYCLPLAGASVIAFALTNVDSIIVGRVLGPLALGFYALAYNIAGWPVSVFGRMVNEVALPAFAHNRHDEARLPTMLASVFALAAAVALPVSALCLGLADSLVACVYGTKWAAAAAVLAVLGAFGSMRILITVLTIYLTAMGASRAVLAIQVAWIVLLIPALILGTRADGIVGAGVVQPLVAGLGIFPLALLFIHRNGGGGFGNLARACIRPLLGTSLTAAWLVGVRLVTEPGWDQLLIGGLGGVMVYAGLTGPWLRRLVTRVRLLWDEPVPTPAVGAE
jgi:PST family polysaccharide transporter